jgi:hypothetical protein
MAAVMKEPWISKKEMICEEFLYFTLLNEKI